MKGYHVRVSLEGVTGASLATEVLWSRVFEDESVCLRALQGPAKQWEPTESF